MYRFLIILVLFLAANNTGYCQKADEPLSFLPGTWIIEGKETFEHWATSGQAALQGKSYKIYDGKEKVLETLEIREENGVLEYLATVPTQNEGRTIPFKLNKDRDDLFSFENQEHDFPKKIQYEFLSADTLMVRVLGEEEQGFSYRLIRQKEAGN